MEKILKDMLINIMAMKQTKLSHFCRLARKLKVTQNLEPNRRSDLILTYKVLIFMYLGIPFKV